MDIVVVLFFGWPAIAIFLIIAAVGVLLRNSVFLIVALILSLPNCYYLLGANNWFQLMSIAIPAMLGFSAIAVKQKWFVISVAVLLPIYLFYGYFFYLVMSQ
ncbi:MAG: hypothetical protein L3J88_04280 [Gammaproteobacteria bacterium]|nr:hypothetical protein [Gammaproteobacteria bacterium]MCF6362565.1 hypothetical protein [Gammaproteobacteria bacterium]